MSAPAARLAFPAMAAAAASVTTANVALIIDGTGGTT
jgi:hypothetical protein